jgi:ribosomal protein S18 acetylase RimI-like enzyme
MTTAYRDATIEDAHILEHLNQQLVSAEGHRTRLAGEKLVERMTQWLSSDYSAVLFSDSANIVGYALYRDDSDYIYLRQFYISTEYRRQGCGRAAIDWLRKNRWAHAPRIRIDVLVGNTTGIAFWKSVGFADYCITMELP